MDFSDYLVTINTHITTINTSTDKLTTSFLSFVEENNPNSELMIKDIFAALYARDHWKCRNLG
jgi:hypothetical protein